MVAAKLRNSSLLRFMILSFFSSLMQNTNKDVKACVNRVIKSVLPDNVQVTKDARAAITRAAGIFIFYLTHWYALFFVY